MGIGRDLGLAETQRRRMIRRGAWAVPKWIELLGVYSTQRIQHAAYRGFERA